MYYILYQKIVYYLDLIFKIIAFLEIFVDYQKTILLNLATLAMRLSYYYFDE